MSPGSWRDKYEIPLRAALAEFGERLDACAWIGSLAHGGFSNRYSDIDVAFLFYDLPEPAWLEPKLDAIRAKLPEPTRWSLFWSSRTLNGGRMPVPDRIDLIDNGVWLKGKLPEGVSRPDREELRDYLKSHSVPYWLDLAESKEAAADNSKRIMRLALYPARFVLSWETGRIASNEDAVNYVPEGAWPLDRDLLREALCLRANESECHLDTARVRSQLERVLKSI